jgi:Arc/MetJ-type ribon-helix-helix transcriptional regulator
MSEPKVTVEISKRTHDHLQNLLAGTRFASVSEFVDAVLRDVAYEGNHEQDAFSPREITRIKDKLKLLGYL